MANPSQRGMGAPAGPNIVFILTDDQRLDTLWAMPTVQSELMAKGVTFQNAFVVNSLCCPSRSTILTGNYSHTTGVYVIVPTFGPGSIFQDDSTVATLLHGAGYQTGLIGKYLNGYDQPDTGYIPPGWDRWFAVNSNGGNGSYYNYSVSDQGVSVSYGSAEADYSTDVFAAQAQSFILEADPAKPLFLYFAPKAPHEPAIPAPRHQGAFSGLEDYRPPSYNEADVSDKPAWVQALPSMSQSEQDKEDRFRIDQYESLLAVDDAVQTILDALSQTGRLSNTMVVFTSDNGIQWGEHRWTNKQDAYEASIRVPLVIRYDPLTAAASTDLDLVANIDFTPTFADLAGLPAPNVEGLSLMPLIESAAVTWRDDFLVEHQLATPRIPTFCAVRNTGFVYVAYSTGESELYDLAADPYQLENLAADPARYATRDAMRARLHDLCAPAPPGYDTTPPVVTITSGPSDPTTETTATLSFEASEPAASFACSLDGAPSLPCDDGSAVYTGLPFGQHTFSVVGTDPAGNPSQPAIWTWTVAAGTVVSVADFSFSPKSIQLPVGGTVVWTFEGASDHTATDATGLDLFDSGPVGPGGAFEFTFWGAGRYSYQCTIHPALMSGTVNIPITVRPRRGHSSTVFTVTWASRPAPTGYGYDVQVRRPGSTQWQDWRVGETGSSATFVADAGLGMYSFRARVRSTDTGQASQYSGAASIQVT